MKVLERIEIVDKLTSKPLVRLLNDQTLVLIVRNYYPLDQAQILARRILENQDIEKYTHEIKDKGKLMKVYLGVDRKGLPFNSTYGESRTSSKSEKYYRYASDKGNWMREMSAPFISPIDLLRLDLDDQSPAGARIARFENRKMLAGMARVTRSEYSQVGSEQPHFDALPPQFANLQKQLAANIYLAVPEKGGELELWDVPPLCPLQETPSQWRQALAEPVRITPQIGDLVFFDCRRPHAVLPFAGPDRVSVQMFIGKEELSNSLVFWN